MSRRSKRRDSGSSAPSDPLAVYLNTDEAYRKGRTEYAKALEKAWDHYLKFVDLMISSAMGSALIFIASVKLIEWNQLPGIGFVAPSIASGLLAFAMFVLWRFASQHYLELQLLHPTYVFELPDSNRPANAPHVNLMKHPAFGIEKVAWGPRLHRTALWKWFLRPVVWFCWRLSPFFGFVFLVVAWVLALLALFSKSPSWLHFPW